MALVTTTPTPTDDDEDLWSQFDLMRAKHQQAPASSEEFKCENCGAIDSLISTNDVCVEFGAICTKCGLVCDNLIISTEANWDNTAAEGSVHFGHHGPLQNLRHTEEDLSTGVIMPRFVPNNNTTIPWWAYSCQSSALKTQLSAEACIREILSRVSGLEETRVFSTACEYYQRFYKKNDEKRKSSVKNITRGDVRDCVYCICIYYACIDIECARSVQEIAAMGEVEQKKLIDTMKRFAELGIVPTKSFNIEQLLPRTIDDRLSRKTHMKIHKTVMKLNRLFEHYGKNEGRYPSTLLLGFLYIAYKQHDLMTELFTEKSKSLKHCLQVFAKKHGTTPKMMTNIEGDYQELLKLTAPPLVGGVDDGSSI